MTSLETSIQIHEFSREFINVTQKNGKFVSGGFGANEITNKTYAVPDKIKQAVTSGDLRINDNYPPSQQEFALLAKEIDEYAILAVATREHDDKNRPLIAYRYFWLAKPQDNDSNNHLDGIGTLILWWHESNQPKFNFQNDLKCNNLQYNVCAFSKVEVYAIINQDFGAISAEYIANIKSYPHITLKNPDETNSYLKLHHLALHLHKEFKTPLSWAWNVGILENPKKFAIIWAANQEICEQITHELKKHQKLLSQNINENDLTVNPSLVSCLTNPIKSQQQCVPDFGAKLKQIILDITNNINNKKQEQLQEKIQELLLILEQHSIRHLDSENIIDNNQAFSQLYPGKPHDSTVIYRAILVLLGFEDLYKWLNWLSKTSKSNFDTSFQVQSFIFEFSRSKKYTKAFYQIRELVFDNLSNLLLHCLQPQLSYEKYKLINLFLLNTNNLWSSHFKLYTQSLVRNLISNTSDSFFNERKFYKQLVSDVLKYEESRQNQLNLTLKNNYYSLALLIRKLGNNSLSALFYQLSEGTVPKNIYSRADVQIIPLNRKQTIHKIQKIGSFINEKILIIVGLLCIFISFTGISWILATEYLSQHQENPSNRYIRRLGGAQAKPSKTDFKNLPQRQ